MGERSEQYADSRTKRQTPSQRVDDQSEVAGMADDRIDAACDQRVLRLNRDQSAEAVAEHEDRPEPQHATGGEENHAEPSNGVAVDGPEFDAVGVGRQIGVEQPKHSEGYEDPAVATILTHTRAQISARKKRYARHREKHHRQCGQRRVGEEGCKPAPAEDCHAKIGGGAHEDEHQSDA